MHFSFSLCSCLSYSGDGSHIFTSINYCRTKLTLLHFCWCRSNQNDALFSDRTVVVDQERRGLSLSGTSTKSIDSDVSPPPTPEGMLLTPPPMPPPMTNWWAADGSAVAIATATLPVCCCCWTIQARCLAAAWDDFFDRAIDTLQLKQCHRHLMLNIERPSLFSFPSNVSKKLNRFKRFVSKKALQLVDLNDQKEVNRKEFQPDSILTSGSYQRHWNGEPMTRKALSNTRVQQPERINLSPLASIWSMAGMKSADQTSSELPEPTHQPSNSKVDSSASPTSMASAPGEHSVRRRAIPVGRPMMMKSTPYRCRAGVEAWRRGRCRHDGRPGRRGINDTWTHPCSGSCCEVGRLLQFKVLGFLRVNVRFVFNGMAQRESECISALLPHRLCKCFAEVTEKSIVFTLYFAVCEHSNPGRIDSRKALKESVYKTRSSIWRAFKS